MKELDATDLTQRGEEVGGLSGGIHLRRLIFKQVGKTILKGRLLAEYPHSIPSPSQYSQINYGNRYTGPGHMGLHEDQVGKQQTALPSGSTQR